MITKETIDKIFSAIRVEEIMFSLKEQEVIIRD